MLTVKGFESSGAAGKYYSHGDYYGSEGTGEWYGKGAEELGLTGEFNASTDPRFKAVLEGRINEDNPLGRMHKGKWEHRPGYDLTFSAPKSFSIEVNLRSDPKRQVELKQIMQNAAKRTLDYASKRGLIQVRKGKAGIEKENVDKLAYALFAHSTNRKLEPQEHIHSFLANVAICEDGKMRSINVDKIINRDGTIKLLGQIFRNELAYDLKQNGEKLRATILSDGSSSFEFAHISDGLIKAFSTRRQEIEELCEKYGVTTKQGRDKIVINSREAKRKVEKADLIKTWEKVQSEVLKKEAVNSRVEVVQEEKGDEEVKNNEKSGLSTLDIEKLCVLDASSKKSVFGHNDLVKSIIKYTIGDATITKLEEAVTKLVDEGELIKHNDRYTTLALLQKEKEILKIAKKSLNSAKPLLKESYFKKECKKFEDRQASLNNKFLGLNDSQKNGLKYILTSKDNMVELHQLHLLQNDVVSSDSCPSNALNSTKHSGFDLK
jgi:conjugative relaxase-like TrwC/TraI family protein